MSGRRTDPGFPDDHLEPTEGGWDGRTIGPDRGAFLGQCFSQLYICT